MHFGSLMSLFFCLVRSSLPACVCIFKVYVCCDSEKREKESLNYVRTPLPCHVNPYLSYEE